MALWCPQDVPFFNLGGAFRSGKGMLAVASAKAGIVMEQPAFYGNFNALSSFSHKRNFPNRLICGIGESTGNNDSVDDSVGSPPYTAKYMLDNFIHPQTRDKRILNLFHTNWGARLIPVDRSAPASAGHSALHWVLAAQKLHSWSGSDVEDAGTWSALPGISDLSDSTDLAKLIVH